MLRRRDHGHGRVLKRESEEDKQGLLYVIVGLLLNPQGICKHSHQLYVITQAYLEVCNTRTYIANSQGHSVLSTGNWNPNELHHDRSCNVL